jgi:hypothetical protein
MIAFIDDHREAYEVEPICKVLPIAPSPPDGGDHDAKGKLLLALRREVLACQLFPSKCAFLQQGVLKRAYCQAAERLFLDEKVARVLVCASVIIACELSPTLPTEGWWRVLSHGCRQPRLRRGDAGAIALCATRAYRGGAPRSRCIHSFVKL